VKDVLLIPTLIQKWHRAKRLHRSPGYDHADQKGGGRLHSPITASDQASKIRSASMGAIAKVIAHFFSHSFYFFLNPRRRPHQPVGVFLAGNPIYGAALTFPRPCIGSVLVFAPSSGNGTRRRYETDRRPANPSFPPAPAPSARLVAGGFVEALLGVRVVRSRQGKRLVEIIERSRAVPRHPEGLSGRHRSPPPIPARSDALWSLVGARALTFSWERSAKTAAPCVGPALRAAHVPPGIDQTSFGSPCF